MANSPELKKPNSVNMGSRGFPGSGSGRVTTLYDLFKNQQPPDRPATLTVNGGLPNEADWLQRGGLTRPPKPTR